MLDNYATIVFSVFPWNIHCEMKMSDFELKVDFDLLCSIFPFADKTFINELLISRKYNLNRLEQVSNILLNSNEDSKASVPEVQMISTSPDSSVQIIENHSTHTAEVQNYAKLANSYTSEKKLNNPEEVTEDTSVQIIDEVRILDYSNELSDFSPAISLESISDSEVIDVTPSSFQPLATHNGITFMDDVLDQEMETLSTILPHLSRTQIRSTLIQNFEKNERLNFTLNELSAIPSCSSSCVTFPTPSHSTVDTTSQATVSSDHSKHCNNTQISNSENPKDMLSETPNQSDLDEILDIFPDADPSFIIQELSLITNEKEKVPKLVTKLLEMKSYPKASKLPVIDPNETLVKKYSDLTLKEFIAMFDNQDPFGYFKKIRDVSLNYKNNCVLFLKVNHPHIPVKKINEVFKNNKFLLTPTTIILKDWNQVVLSKKRYYKSGIVKYAIDEEFLKEMAYLRLKVEIDHYFLITKNEREREFQEASRTGALLECSICCEGDLVLSDFLPCEEGHLFCKTCVKRHAECIIGESKTFFPCLENDCDKYFSYTILQELLKPSVFSKLLIRKQTEEVLAANIPDLVSCPFCNFATIMPDPNDKIFKCLNPECSRESCRLCREPTHIPLRCEEVEKEIEMKARVNIENQLSESIIRECYKCQKKFIKGDGCNKMTCSCGAQMCYVCKLPVKGYDHFSENDPNKCPLWSNSTILHAEEIRKTAEDAKQRLMLENPELSNKIDPTKHVPVVPQNLKRKSDAMRAERENWERTFAELQREHQRLNAAFNFPYYNNFLPPGEQFLPHLLYYHGFQLRGRRRGRR